MKNHLLTLRFSNSQFNNTSRLLLISTKEIEKKLFIIVSVICVKLHHILVANGRGIAIGRERHCTPEKRVIIKKNCHLKENRTP